MPRIALVFTALIVSALSMRAVPEHVTVDGGQIAGAVDRGVRVFKGIPFAAPPVGALRWRPPQPVAAWSGVHDASRFGAECPQTQYPAGSVYIRPIQTQSEDCLFLNLAHPELTAESPQHSSGNYGVLDQIAALKWVPKKYCRLRRRSGGGDDCRRVGGSGS